MAPRLPISRTSSVAAPASAGPHGARGDATASSYHHTERRDRRRLTGSERLLRKVLRLNDDGTVPPDNPFAGRAGHKPEIYTFGHRNSLGLAAHPMTGEMWQSEMGPNGGDEINILKPGANYGWPMVSLGRRLPGPLAITDVLKRGDRIAGRLLDAGHLPVRE